MGVNAFIHVKSSLPIKFSMAEHLSKSMAYYGWCDLTLAHVRFLHLKIKKSYERFFILCYIQTLSYLTSARIASNIFQCFADKNRAKYTIVTIVCCGTNLYTRSELTLRESVFSSFKTIVFKQLTHKGRLLLEIFCAF